MVAQQTMKGGEALSQLLKNVQGKKSSGSSTNTVVIVFLVVSVLAVLVGTFYMVQSLKKDQQKKPVVVTPVTETTPEKETTTSTALSSAGLGTQEQPLIQKQADQEGPYIKSPLSGSGLFNVPTQQQDPSDPYATMRVIGTVMILGTNQIRALGEGALETAYAGQKTVIDSIKKEEEKQFDYNQRLFLMGKRVRGNWFYYMTQSDKDEPVIPMYIQGRNCGDPNSTGCKEIFSGQYYSFDTRMSVYFGTELQKIMNNNVHAPLLRMVAELYPIVY